LQTGCNIGVARWVADTLNIKCPQEGGVIRWAFLLNDHPAYFTTNPPKNNASRLATVLKHQKKHCTAEFPGPLSTFVWDGSGQEPCYITCAKKTLKIESKQNGEASVWRRQRLEKKGAGEKSVWRGRSLETPVAGEASSWRNQWLEKPVPGETSGWRSQRLETTASGGMSASEPGIVLG